MKTDISIEEIAKYLADNVSEDDHSELEISGEFWGVNERYTDTFKNRGEFEWVLQGIARNSVCCYPNKIYGGIAEDRLPKYVKDWMKATGAEYVKGGHSED